MSRFGALLDPVADRFFVLAVVISYVMGGQFTVWQAIAIMFRDVMSVIGFFVARNVSWLRPIPFQARLIGKAVTAAQLLTFSRCCLCRRPVDCAGDARRRHWASAATIDYTLMLWRERVRDRCPVAAVRDHAHRVAATNDERLARSEAFVCVRTVDRRQSRAVRPRRVPAPATWAAAQSAHPSVRSSTTSVGLSSG